MISAQAALAREALRRGNGYGYHDHTRVYPLCDETWCPFLDVSVRIEGETERATKRRSDDKNHAVVGSPS